MNILRRVGLLLIAPILALAAAALVTSLVLIFADAKPGAFWDVMLTWPAHRNLVNILNNASVLYLAGLAAAIGFRMNLFNIGVEGQYRVATFVAAVFAAQAWLPGYLNMVATLLVAMAAGGLWAAIPAVLKVTRGVSEVISTIMLNAIAVSLVAYLLRKAGSRQGQAILTDQIPDSSWVGGITVFEDSPAELYGLAVLAVIAGIAFTVLINWTRFGFELRATGQSESAAVASGVNVKRMVLYAMVMSGAVAGLIGMPNLFGVAHSYGSTIQTGIGFAGIAVALLGRNHPVGIAFGALVFAWLTEQSNPLGILAGISPDVILITQGVVVLSVVIAYEVVRRYRQRLEQGAVADALAAAGKTEEVRA
jgi:general nucleoside transport system permease protein